MKNEMKFVIESVLSERWKTKCPRCVMFLHQWKTKSPLGLFAPLYWGKMGGNSLSATMSLVQFVRFARFL